MRVSLGEGLKGKSIRAPGRLDAQRPAMSSLLVKTDFTAFGRILQPDTGHWPTRANGSEPPFGWLPTPPASIKMPGHWSTGSPLDLIDRRASALILGWGALDEDKNQASDGRFDGRGTL